MTEIILEIVRYTVPSLTVFGVVYYLMTKQENFRLRNESIKLREEQRKSQSLYQLQAYERLIMLCERIDPMNLYLRLNVSEMSVKQLESSMLIAIRQEVEHNWTQQLFVSPELWKIVMLSSNQVAHMVSHAAEKLNDNEPASSLIALISNMENELGNSPLFTAKNAIKNEFETRL